MIRKIIKIDEEKCNGCGACAAACHEGAIRMIDGVARLVREDYCDGLGDCLPACPVGAISFEEREAPAYDAAAVQKAKTQQTAAPFTCPGTRVKTFSPADTANRTRSGPAVSRLAQWPCQIRLVPVNAPYFAGADLLIAADCTAFACANIHEAFMRNRITLIGCPKLDAADYSDKLTRIIAENNIRSLMILRMEVPCCGGLENAVKKALRQSGKILPLQVVTLSTDGKFLP